MWNQASRQWRVYGSRLPQAPANRSYQLWFVPPTGNPVSARVFNTNANLSAKMEIALPLEITDLKAAAVTDEPAGGQPQPTGGFVLSGNTE